MVKGASLKDSKVVTPIVSVVNAKTNNPAPALTNVKKTIVKKVGIKKPEVKKWVTQKPAVIVDDHKKVESATSNPVEMINDNVSGKKEEPKTPTPKVEKIVKKTVKKTQKESSDDIVESILSRDPNFFDSGEDF